MIIKTCGLRSPDNIRVISHLNIDYLGFIFYPKSQRFIGEDKTLLRFLQSEEGRKLPQKRVGVFVNATHRELFETVAEYQLDYVQLHGAEGPMYCEAIQNYWLKNNRQPAKIIRAFRVSNFFDFNITIDYEAYCDYFVFDTKGQLPGGNGQQFNWRILDRYKGKTSFLLSGGIGPDDVKKIQALKHPAMAGIDINSKFEVEPALKNIPVLTQFVNEFRKKSDEKNRH